MWTKEKCEVRKTVPIQMSMAHTNEEPVK